MNHRIELETRARRNLLDLPADVQDRIADAIDDLQSDPRPPGCKKLTGKEGYRVRKGDYRILYTIDDTTRTVRIYDVGHRRDIYRGR